MQATLPPAASPTLRRVLGRGGAAALSIGVMAPTLAMSIVGPEPAKLVGRAAPLAFGAAGLLVLLVSAGFVRLSAHFAHAGSVYAFVGGSVGPRAGAFTGWTMLGTYLVFPWVSVAGVTVFGGELLRLAGLSPDWFVLALGGWALVGALAAGGLRPAVWALIGFELAAVLLILALMAVIVTALAGGHAPRGQLLNAEVIALPTALPAGAVVLAATAAFLAYCGFEAAGSLGEEAPEPQRVVPRAMIVTILLGAAFYVTCVAVQVWGFGTDPAGLAAFTASSAPLGALAMAYVGPGLAAALYVAALISAVGAGLGCVLVAVRMLFALGRDGVLPAMLSRVCTRTGTPTTAVGVELAVGLVTITGFRLAGAAPARMFFVLATIGVLHLLAMYAITDVAAVRYLRRAGNGRWSLLAAAVGAVVAAAVLAQTLTTAPLALRLTVLGWLSLGAVPALRAGTAPRPQQLGD
jgi:amino acid transporter